MVMGCDFGQDVLIAPPMPQQRFLALLRQRVNRPCPPAPAATPDEAAFFPRAASPED
jgi:hypothetical protein